MNKENQVVISESESYSPATIDGFISQAISSNVPVETLERIFALREKVKAEMAKEAFDTAMADFQMECPVIAKNKKVTNDSGKHLYSYAPIESIVSQTKEYIAKNGFSYAIKTEMTESRVKVYCIVKHKMGHSETTDVDMPLSTRTGIMSAPQQTAATLTFGKRYAFCNAFGIMTGDDDTDASKDTVDGDVKPVPVAVKKPVQPVRTTPLASTEKKSISNDAPKRICPYCGDEHTGMYPKCFNCWKNEKDGKTLVKKETKTLVNPDAEPFPS